MNKYYFRPKYEKKKLLNVGGNNKQTPLPPEYESFEHILIVA